MHRMTSPPRPDPAWQTEYHALCRAYADAQHRCTALIRRQQRHIAAVQEALWRTGLADARSMVDSLEAHKNGEAWYRRELARCGEEWTLRLPEEDERTALRIVTEYEHSRGHISSPVIALTV